MSETGTIVWPAIKALNGIPGVVACRLHSGKPKVRGGYMQSNPIGTADIVASVHGAVVFIEAKLPGEKLRAEQRMFQDRVERTGARYEIIESSSEAIAIALKMLKERQS